MTEDELVQGCLKFERASQLELYQLYCNRMMHLCIRYAKNQQDAKEILLDGFKNIFNGFHTFAQAIRKIKKDAPSIPLNEWIKKEIIAAAVQHMHSNKKEYFVSSTVSMRDSERSSNGELSDAQIINAADIQMIIKALRELTPSYRAIYNLHEVDGYSHLEISKLLDISEYISKDSLSKAKFNLRKTLARMIPKTPA